MIPDCTGIGEQYLNGSPVNDGKQLHVGICEITWHKALAPHVPGHGSIHLLFIQALLVIQSVFTIHSGRQPSYGLPKYSGKHVHEPAPCCSLQIALTPQGDGTQGERCSTGFGSAANETIKFT